MSEVSRPIPSLVSFALAIRKPNEPGEHPSTLLPSAAVVLPALCSLAAASARKLARRLNLPLIRTGFPIHDRFGGQRVLHIGHRGAQRFYDVIVNTLLERKQDNSEMGYTYL